MDLVGCAAEDASRCIISAAQQKTAPALAASIFRHTQRLALSPVGGGRAAAYQCPDPVIVLSYLWHGERSLKKSLKNFSAAHIPPQSLLIRDQVLCMGCILPIVVESLHELYFS